MKHRLIALVLSAVLLLGVCACSSGDTGGGSGGNTPGSAQPTASESGGGSSGGDYKVGVILSGPPTDGGFCQQGADGIRGIQAAYGLSDDQVSIIDSVTTAETARAEAEAMAADGYTVVFGQGGQFAEYFREVAEQYPDTFFVTLGGEVTGPNQFPLCINIEEGSYISGVIAGMVTQSNQLGVVVGGDYPSYTKAGVGFALGAKAVNPDVSVSQVVLSTANANEAYETAMNMISSGTDVIFPNADAGNTGTILAVEQSDGVYSFGVYGDYTENAPEKVLANITADYAGAYVAAFEAIINGETTGDVMYLGVGDGIVNFSWNEELKATLPEDVVTAAEQAIADIQAGEIDIPNEYEIGAQGAESYFS